MKLLFCFKYFLFLVFTIFCVRYLSSFLLSEPLTVMQSYCLICLYQVLDSIGFKHAIREVLKENILLRDNKLLDDIVDAIHLISIVIVLVQTFIFSSINNWYLQ